MQPYTVIVSVHEYLTLDHLERCLYSLSRQTIQVERFLLFCSNFPFSEVRIKKVVGLYFDCAKVEFVFYRHKRTDRTLAYSSNAAIGMAPTEHFIMLRADMIYDFDYINQMLRHYQWDVMSYVTSWYFFMPLFTPKATLKTVNHAADLEPLKWREDPKRLLKNNKPHSKQHKIEHTNAWQDGPCFCTSKTAMNLAGWYDWTLVGWGYDQQDLQTQMMKKGVRMKVIPEFLCFHMEHDSGPRNTEKAMEIWSRSPRRVNDILEEEKRLIEQAKQPQPNEPAST